ncbi:RidA family protein [Desertimonas flava]|uniref:RidA family protein n=1 Tax=Desertimonas flava TaxID=2064846 RepID=UPI001968C964|nr:RidA family protein [Desertimonas flava]
MATSIEVQGLHHGGMPIPSAARRGPLVATGGIPGLDPTDGSLPGRLEAQVARVFANIEAIIAAAGGTVGDIVKITFHVADRSARDLINQHWVDMFPDEAARPARHTIARELGGAQLVQADFIAFVGSDA